MDSHPENAAMICRSFPAMLRAVQGHIYIRRFPECWTFALGRSDLRAGAKVVLSVYDMGYGMDRWSDAIFLRSC